MSFQPRIAIIGAGPSGLALGLLLQQRGVQSTIYELRSQPTTEELAKPSGMLDLHEESGLTVMRECGLWDDFESSVGDCSEECRVMNPQGTLLHSDQGELEPRPEISRNALLDIIMKKLPSEYIKWNSKIIAVRESRSPDTGALEITLDLGANGSATYDFVIGADGAWSKVRKLLTDVKPFYSGAQIITVTARNASTRFPHLVKLTGSGTLNALGGSNGILTHRAPQDSIRIYATVSSPHENWTKEAGVEGKTAAEIKPLLLSDDKYFGTWAPSLQELLSTACDEETKDNPGRSPEIYPLYMLPIGDRWETRTCATLIGDAAHLMTPFAGEGVNLALWDSLDLAHVLEGAREVHDAVEWQAAIEPRLRDFEETMLSRAQEKAEETARNKELMLSENGGERLADLFKQMFAGVPGQSSDS